MKLGHIYDFVEGHIIHNMVWASISCWIIISKYNLNGSRSWSLWFWSIYISELIDPGPEERDKIWLANADNKDLIRTIRICPGYEHSCLVAKLRRGVASGGAVMRTHCKPPSVAKPTAQVGASGCGRWWATHYIRTAGRLPMLSPPFRPCLFSFPPSRSPVWPSHHACLLSYFMFQD